ncbi:type VI secretion system baseplate subunit TssK [Chitinivorax sp. PXF-14]|uniref:type VI secretion system baseplate subunit TssK n=1 Tax=Chitinivorax sp. PXF-14 TaxID=3230488 RepID=UPI003465E228
MSWNSKVIWSEGMFLEPQHFQQHDRHVERMIEGRVAPIAPFGWGFSRLELDAAALTLGKVQLREAKGVLPDGTPFDFPAQDAPPDALDIPPDTRSAKIYLALPVRRVGLPEATSDGDALARYLVETREVVDTHSSADHSAPIDTGRLALRLLREQDATDAYALLGCVRVVERRADNQLTLDRGYIPPMLSVAADTTLSSYANELHGLLHQRAETLAARLGQPGRGGVAEIADFLFLQTLNRCEPLFAHLAGHPLLHPERLFAVSLMLAGELSTFSQSTRRPSAMPGYHHDALETCFPPLMDEIRRTLTMVMEQTAIPIELQDRKYGIRVAVIPDPELTRHANFVLAVNAQMPSEAVRTRFPAQLKIGPVDKIRDLVNLQLPGIGLRSLAVAPRELPYHAGFHYFELDRNGELWKQLERTGGLAMHVSGEFPGLEMEFWAIRE